MTPNEFKAWFDGFTEAFSGQPTKTQWSRIKERVAEIDGRPITERIYLDRYWPSQPYYWPYWQAPNAGRKVTWGLNSSAANQAQGAANSFNSVSAMYAIGKNDAMALSCSNGVNQHA